MTAVPYLSAPSNHAAYSSSTQKASASAPQDSLLESMKNNFSFFSQFVKSPTTVGSLFPSSTKLAKEIVRQIPGKEISGPPRRYLEVGPGLGTFTTELVEKLRAEDRLFLVEFDEKFAEILRKKFGHLKNVTTVHGDFTQFHSDIPFDYCVSGLPLAAFDPETVKKIYNVFDRIVKKNGVLAYFEYLGIPQFKKLTLNEKFKQVLALKDSYFSKHQGSSTDVWQNLPPARVCRVII